MRIVRALKSFAILAVPALLLAGVALMLSRKSVPQEPFALKIEEVRFRRLMTQAKNNWRMEVTVYLRHKGATPDWWLAPGTNIGNVVPTQFIGGDGKTYRPGAWGTSGGAEIYNKKRDCYIFQTIVNTGVKRSQMAPATFVGFLTYQSSFAKPVTRIPIRQRIEDRW